jgi:hypothetical protein
MYIIGLVFLLFTPACIVHTGKVFDYLNPVIPGNACMAISVYICKFTVDIASVYNVIHESQM